MQHIKGPSPAAPVGSVGNNTHPGVVVDQFDEVAIDFVVEAVGATPTVTFAVEGSLDGVNWFPLQVLPTNSETPAANATVTSVGHHVRYTLLGVSRFAGDLRVVTTANTNVTYSAGFWGDVKK